jgi:hypothetical protein
MKIQNYNIINNTTTNLRRAVSTAETNIFISSFCENYFASSRKLLLKIYENYSRNSCQNLGENIHEIKQMSRV